METVVIPDHIDNNRPEKLLHVPHVDKMTINDGLHTQPEYSCDKDQEVNGGHAKTGLGDGVVTPDHIVHKMTITDILHTQPEYGCGKDQEVNGSHAFQEKPKRSRVPLRPVSSTGFDANQCYDPQSCPGGLQHDITGWHSCPCPARPENENYSRNANNLPFHGSNERHNFMHGEYREVGFDPTGMYPYQPRTDVNIEGPGAAYGGCNRGYGARSNYTFALGSRRPAAGSVTDRYAPHLEQTNNPQRG
ncbi:hypothetical protein HU200_007881 [Digitaria exilis]|uniref:Uncharacterized protein n=1 Tax=Digitaria exilis TaxID=1010633 RepID=A0A835KU40_9POAL|nr:hypothetical protein HU200_007881 [Digitaria exilis]